jgi:hypothetical protein
VFILCWRDRLPSLNECCATWLAVFAVLPFDRVFRIAHIVRKRSADDVANLVIVAVIKISAFTHGLVACTLAAPTADEAFAFGSVAWPVFLAGALGIHGCQIGRVNFGVHSVLAVLSVGAANSLHAFSSWFMARASLRHSISSTGYCLNGKGLGS